MKFFEAGGWWLPDDEEHLQEWQLQMQQRRGDRLLYQDHKYQVALSAVKPRDMAIDIGAHVGFFSWQMAQDFKEVLCFEPFPEHYICWRMNMREMANATLYPIALGNENSDIKMSRRQKHSSGDTGIDIDGTTTVTMKKLDDVLPDLFRPSFIKVDCEGYEYHILKGAERTLLDSRPVVMVEQKPGLPQRYGLGQTDAVQYLESLGARQFHDQIAGDYFLKWG